jgi:predicted ATPase
VASLPVLLIVTYRPEFQPSWTGPAHVSALSLSRLGRREGAALAAQVASDSALSSDITAEIVERADGIPLFVEELTKALLEAGAHDGDGTKTITTAPLSALAVPATLQASLIARLDRLGPLAREVAQVAAVIGREFSYELVAPVAQKSDHDLQAALARLGDAGLVFCRGTAPQATFLFKHALVRDAAYGTLLRGQRQQIHARVSATLENQFPEIVAGQPQLIAQHCAEAGLNEKAVGYHLKAGQQALARSAMTEAVAQLQKGLDLLGSLPENALRGQQELDLHIALGRALLATRGHSSPAVGETIVRARTLAEQLDRPDYLVPLLHFQWVFHLMRGEHKLALSFAEETEKVGEAQSDKATLLLGHVFHGVSRFYLGEFVAARALCEQCHGLRDPAHRAVYATLMAEDPHALNLIRRAVALAVLGYIDQAHAQMDEALSEARQLEHAHTLVEVLIFACLTKWVGGSVHEVRRCAEEAIALSNEHGFQSVLGPGLVSRGWSLSALGQAEEGLSLITQGLSALRDAGSLSHTPWALTLLAESYAKLGQLEEGLNCVAEAAEIIETTDERFSEAEMHRVRGELIASMHDDGAAEVAFREAINVAERQSAKLWELRSSASLARLWRDQGKRTEARNLLAPIYGWFTEGFDTADLKEAKMLLDELT